MEITVINLTGEELFLGCMHFPKEERVIESPVIESTKGLSHPELEEFGLKVREHSSRFNPDFPEEKEGVIYLASEEIVRAALRSGRKDFFFPDQNRQEIYWPAE